MIRGFKSPFFDFNVLWDGTEWRFTTLDGNPSDLWDNAIPGELLDEMTEEYARIKDRMQRAGKQQEH